MEPTMKPFQGDSNAIRDDHTRSDSGTRIDSDTRSVRGPKSTDEILNDKGNSIAREIASTSENTSRSNINDASVNIGTKTDRSEEVDACRMETDRQIASTTNTMICGDLASISDSMSVDDDLDTLRSLSLSTLGSLSTIGSLSSSGSSRQRSVLALSRILNRSHYISREQLWEASQPGTGALVGALHGPNSTFLMDDEVELNNGAQIQLRHLILYNDTLIIAKPKSTNSLKLKKQVRLSEVWVASCLDEVTVKEICADTSFVIGWPTTNSVVTFCSPETKERWFSALHCNIQEQKQNVFPKNMTLRILLMEVDELTSTTLITVTSTETTEKVIGRAVYQLGLSGQASDFLLWVNSSKEALSYPLIGHESLYSIAQTNLRHVPQHTTLRTNIDCSDPTSLSQVPENKQYKFILKHKSELPSVLERERSEKKSLKKRKSLLYWALQKNPNLALESSMVQSPEEENDHKIFGLHLSILCRTGHLPKPIMDMLMLLYKEGPTTAGIFRRSANTKTCKEIKGKLNSGAQVSMAGESVFVAASVLSEFLRNIPDSVLSSGMHSQWMTAMQGRTSQQKVNSLQRLVAQLPEGNRLLLKYLFGVLSHIVANSEENQMTAFNLALCVAPNLLWLPNPKRPEDESQNMSKVTKLVQFMIENTMEIFGEDIPALLLKAQAESATCAEDTSALRTIKGFYELQLQEDEDKNAEAQKETEVEAPLSQAETQDNPAHEKIKMKIKMQAQPREAQTELAQEKASAQTKPVEAWAEEVDAKAMLAQVQAKLAQSKTQPVKAKAKAKAKMALALAEPVEVQAKSPKAKVRLAVALPELSEVQAMSPKAKVKLALALAEPVKVQERSPKSKAKKTLALTEPAETRVKPANEQIEPTEVWSKPLEVQAEAQTVAIKEQARAAEKQTHLAEEQPKAQAKPAERQAKGQAEVQVEPAEKQADPSGGQSELVQESAEEQLVAQNEPAEKHPEPAEEQSRMASNEQAEPQAESSKEQAKLNEVGSLPSQVEAEAEAESAKEQAEEQTKSAEVQDKLAKEQTEPDEEQAEVQAEPQEEQIEPQEKQTNTAKEYTQLASEEAKLGEEQAKSELTGIQVKEQAEPTNIHGELNEVQTVMGQPQTKVAEEQAREHAELQAEVGKALAELIEAQQNEEQHELDEPTKSQSKPAEEQTELAEVQAVSGATALSSSKPIVRPKESSQKALKQKKLQSCHSSGQAEHSHLILGEGSKTPESLISQDETVDRTSQGDLTGPCSVTRARENTNRCLQAGFALFRSATRWWPKRSKTPIDPKDP